MDDPVLSIDLGGTTMRAAIVTADGEMRDRRSQPTPQDADCPDALVDLAGDVLEAGTARRAVIGVPGRVHYAAGRLEYAPNLPPHWPEALDEAQLTERLAAPVALANDADLAAVGEAFFGAGRDADDVAYVTVSTGVGAGVLLQNRLVAGRRSALELGHTIVDVHATQLSRGASVEDLGSGTALERQAGQRGLPADGAAVTDRVRQGDRTAHDVWEAIVQVIGAAVVNLAHLFTPQVIVLGGGVGRNNADLLLAPLRAHVRDHGPVDLPEPMQLAMAATGDDAGLVGAGAWTTATGGGRS